MMGAYLFFKEPMRWERWLAAGIGVVGVVIVVGPKLSGAGGVYNLVMLASAPLFAASFLLTKGLTRYERVEVIVVWQAITVTLFSLPLALAGTDAGAIRHIFYMRHFGQCRALLPDAVLRYCGYFGHPVGQVSGFAVVCHAGLADFLGHSHPVNTGGRRGDLCVNAVDCQARGTPQSLSQPRASP